MPLPLEQAIPRLKENEERVDVWANQDGTYTTNEAVPREVETIPSLMQRLQDRYLTLLSRGDWTTATAYAINDLVVQDGFVYLSTIPHTSGVFADDLAANRWVLFRDTSGLISSVVDIVALASAPAVDGTIMAVAGTRAGLFKFVGGNLSTSVTTDPMKGIYVAPASDPTGASGAWVRQRSVSGPVDGVLIEWFGAVLLEDNVLADSGPAIQAANDWLETHGRPSGVVHFGKGSYRSYQKLRVGGGCIWRGAGPYATTLQFDTSIQDNLIELGPDQSGLFGYSGSYGFGMRIEYMDINALDVYRSLDKAVIFTNGAHQDSGIYHCNIRNFRSIGVNINDGVGAPVGFHIEDVDFTGGLNPVTGSKIAIRSNGAGSLNLRRVQTQAPAGAPFAVGVRVVKDRLLAEQVHIEGCEMGILLEQQEATVRTAAMINVTGGNSNVAILIGVHSLANVEYTIIGAANSTISGADLKVLVDSKSGFVVGGVGGGFINNYTNVRRLGGNNIAHATTNYSVTSAAIQGGFGVSGVVKNAVGDYTITFSAPAKSSTFVASAAVRMPTGLPGVAVPAGLSTTQMNLKIYNLSGVLTDPDRFHVVVFDAA